MFFQKNSLCGVSTKGDIEEQSISIQLSNQVEAEEEQCIEVGHYELLGKSNQEKPSKKAKGSDVKRILSPGSEADKSQVKPNLNS